MQAQLHPITARARDVPPEPARFSHFALGPGQAVMDPAALLASPRWSLYSVDGPARAAMFVELPEGTSLPAMTFSFMGQFDLAERVLIVPFDLLPALASGMAEPDHTVFLFSIGRCGSTLAGKLMQQGAGVWGLSEPDLYTNIAMNRPAFRDADVAMLLRLGTRLLFRPQAGERTLTIKLRSQALRIAAEMLAGCPNAACLFLYRDPAGWARSLHHFVHSLGEPLDVPPQAQPFFWDIMSGGADPARAAPLFSFSTETQPAYRIIAAGWVELIRQAMAAEAAGVPLRRMDYGRFKQDAAAAAAHLLALAHIGGADPAAIAAVLAQHSQQGTFLDGTSGAPLFTPHRADFLALLATSPHYQALKAWVAADGIMLA